ncbi:MAG TPA: sialidase family protein [Longimicrobiales bacterium]|nr:sialidase family protein [Longimicrobiales bacterium]
MAYVATMGNLQLRGAGAGSARRGARCRLVTAPPLAALALLLALPLGACEGEGEARASRDGQTPASEAQALVFEPLESPAPPASAEPNLAVGPDGFYLSWLERTAPGRHALRFARLGADGWTAPRTVMERTGLFVNWADFPSMVVLEDGTLAAHWLEKSGAGTYAYDVRAAVSTDGGATWGGDMVPHGDGVEAEHGFVSLFPLDGRVGAVWLDGRETAGGEPMTLRFTTLGPEGAAPDILLDAAVCDCCQTGAAIAADGPVVVYRDRTDGEVRDISVVRRVGGEWTEPRLVHEDGWVINACPVNGPAVDAAGRRVVVAWFTGAPDPRAQLVFSDDAGASFAAPIRVDEGAAQGRVDVVLLEDGSALVTWLERAENGAEIRVRRVTPEGAAPAMRLAATSAERASGFPRVARHGDRILFAWTEAGDPSRVRTALGRIAGGGSRPARGAGAGSR